MAELPRLESLELYAMAGYRIGPPHDDLEEKATLTNLVTVQAGACFQVRQVVSHHSLLLKGDKQRPLCEAVKDTVYSYIHGRQATQTAPPPSL